MKRREFGFLTGSSAMGWVMGGQGARANGTPGLGPGLTAFGSEIAGNKAGTIPAYTGGLTGIPDGMTWDPTKTLPPDFFAQDKMLYQVDADNMAQYAHLLSDGLQELIKKTGFEVRVYPTRRTAAYPQFVLDNIAKNITRAKLDPQGGRLGFSGGFCGIPFPIPDISDPYNAGVQLVYNHETRWAGTYVHNNTGSFVVQGGRAPALASAGPSNFYFPYYDPNMDPQNYDGLLYKVQNVSTGPATTVGDEFVQWYYINSLQTPVKTWQVLAGQGRVRRAPDVQYDTPSSYVDGVANYDEYNGFNGAANEYDWKLLGKRGMLIPYNNNKIYSARVEQIFTPKFPNPDYIRWELHRCWVVEATLHPGERNVMARRRLYIDEDIWQIGIIDTWDANGVPYHHNFSVNANFPNLPGTLYQDNYVFNLQTGDYCNMQGNFADAAYARPWIFKPVSQSVFDPQTIAATAAY